MSIAPASLYHFLYLPPALGADWLLSAGRVYWVRFRPIVIDKLDLIDYVPPEAEVVITLLTRRDLATQIIDEVVKRFPNAKCDPLVYDTPGDLQLTLDGRAAFNQRFGAAR